MLSNEISKNIEKLDNMEKKQLLKYLDEIKSEKIRKNNKRKLYYEIKENKFYEDFRKC